MVPHGLHYHVVATLLVGVGEPKPPPKATPHAAIRCQGKSGSLLDSHRHNRGYD